MKVILFKELDRLTNQDLKMQFGVSDVEKIVSKLQSVQVLKKHIPALEIYELDNDLDDIDSEKEFYYFRFVGLLRLDDYFIVVYPKYIGDIKKDFYGTKEKLRKILSVLSRQQLIGTNFEKTNDGNVSFFSLMLAIMQDYQNNGLYTNPVQEFEMNGEGEILWNKTLDLTYPTIMQGIPYYLDVYTSMTNMDLNHPITKLHEAIIHDISVKYGYLLDLFDIQPADVSGQNLHDLGDNEYLQYLIQRELSTQYVTNKQTQLNWMMKYLNGQGVDNSSIDLFGTNSFNMVWEKVVKTIYSDDLSKNIHLLDLTLTSDDGLIDYSYARTLKDVVQKPEWIHSSRVYQANKTLELDALRVNSVDKTFEIYDGKYYRISFTENGVNGQPGVGDISKQYLYQLAFSKLAKLNGYTFQNAFVIPKDDFASETGTSSFAVARLEMLSELGLNDISVIAKDADEAYSEFLQMTSY